MGYIPLRSFARGGRAPEADPGRRPRFSKAGWRAAGRRAALCAAAVAVAALVGFGLVSALRTHRQNMILWSRAEALEGECRRLTEKLSGLEAEAVALQQDPFYVEKSLRRDERRARPGELILERAGN